MEGKRSADSVAAVLSVLATFMYIFRLDHGPLRAWDEAIYADAARNVLDGHVLILKLSGEGHKAGAGVFLEKPPLVPWLQAVSMGVFGTTPMAVRFPSFLAFIGCLVLVVYVATDLFDGVAGIVAGLLLVSAEPVTLHHGPLYGSTDVVLTLAGSLAVWLWIQYQRGDDRDPVQLYGAAVAFGVAVMTKGPAAVPFALVALPAVAWRPRTVRTTRFWFAAGLFVALALPWYLYVFVVAGDVFVHQFLVEQTLRRAAGDYGVDQGGLLPFMRYPYFLNGPKYIGTGLTGIIGLGVGLTAVRSVRRRALVVPNSVLYLLFWGSLFPVVYALLGGNHVWYILPTVVPAAVLGAWALRTLVAWGSGPDTRTR